MRPLLVLLACALLAACSANPSIKDLNCDPAFGSCSASLDPVGYDWYVTTDTECAVVTMESGDRLPLCGYKRLLGQGKEYGIKACRACVKRER